DLNSGAFAAAYYFLSRLPSKPELAERFIPLLEGLEEKALKDADGGYSWAAPSIFGNVYLGLSHGSAMVISLLANLWSRDIEKGSCERIMRNAVEFLLRYKRDVRYGRFALMKQDIDYVVKPFGQCYGDIGVAYALVKAIPILRDDRVDTAAMEVINESITRTYDPPGSPFPTDAGIFYGASGLAATLEKLGQMTGDGRLAEAARYWYRRIPGYAKHENTFAGYQCMFNAESVLYNTSYGWGIIGIGMSLMRYLKPELPPFFELQMIA
ncbi:MAG TPA: lanthionine synthetase LanC family protein, partial [Puia sp.]|nr:lanthionine synthetase LanC family protein [Puia sp.]